jgi:hypothetical protein
MAAAMGERQRRMDAAIEKWGIDAATGFSADAASGTFRFTMPGGDLVGEAQLVGVFAKIGSRWTWGWAVDGIPDEVTALSRSVQSLGHDILAQPTVALTDAQADGLASLAFVQGDDAFLYRAYGAAGDTYLAVRSLAPVA